MNPRLARAIFTIPMVLLPLVVLVPLHRAAAAEGGVFFVDSTEDGIDANPGDGQCATSAIGHTSMTAKSRLHCPPAANPWGPCAPGD